jgi:hypothetical protein
MMSRACRIVLVALALVAVTGCPAKKAEPTRPSKPPSFSTEHQWVPPTVAEPPPKPVPKLEDLQRRLDDAMPQLRAEAEKDGRLDLEAFWAAFCRWLDDQDDFPKETREKYRRAFRMELGLGPEDR